MANLPEELTGIALWRSPAGLLQVGHCKSCDAVHYYPRTCCPFCSSFNVDLREVSGKGVIYSYSFSPRGPGGPFVIAYVTLDEGVSVLTNIIDMPPESVEIGQRVEVVFGDVDGKPAPFFRPAPG